MLITFSSKADMDVLMMDKHARQVLLAAGKITKPEIPERGVFTVEQLDDAIHNLESAIKQEKEHIEPHSDAAQDDDDRDTRPKTEELVLLAQRAAPLLQMMRKSKQANASILWETSSGW